MLVLLTACTAPAGSSSCAERLNQAEVSSERAELAFVAAQDMAQRNPSEQNQARVADMAASAAASVAAVSKVRDEVGSGKCGS